MLDSAKKNDHKNLKTFPKTLRVIGGSFRGLKLFAPLESSTRPTKAILKESLFNTINQEIAQVCFIEGFSGSGSIGIEALSRGARKAVFFENNKSALELLNKNLALIPESSLESKEFEIISNDSFLSLPKFLESLQEVSILYLDPPFSIRQNYADIYKKCVNLINGIENRFVEKIIIEHISSYIFPSQVGRFVNTKYKKFGKSALTYFIQGE